MGNQLFSLDSILYKMSHFGLSVYEFPKRVKVVDLQRNERAGRLYAKLGSRDAIGLDMHPETNRTTGSLVLLRAHGSVLQPVRQKGLRAGRSRREGNLEVILHFQAT